MLRKPYVIRDYMYSNAIRKTPTTIDGKAVLRRRAVQRRGLSDPRDLGQQEEREAWAATDAAAATSRLASDGPGPSTTGPAAPPDPLTLARGELMFRGQCMACHTVNGYRSMRRLLAGRNRESIDNILSMLHRHEDDSPYRAFMPPLVGTPAEIEALGEYLYHLVPPAQATTEEESQPSAAKSP